MGIKENTVELLMAVFSFMLFLFKKLLYNIIVNTNDANIYANDANL